MPPTPSVSPLTRYLFENPWPGIIIAGVLGALVLVGAVRRGATRQVLIGLSLLAVGVAWYLVAALVVTSGEHAAEVTRRFVRHAEEGNASAAIQLLAPSATLALGSPSNPGLDASFFHARLRSLEDQYRIRTNYITELSAYTRTDDTGVVHLQCLTSFDTAVTLPTKSAWVVDVARQSDGSWKITRLTAVKINDQTPTLGSFR